MKLRIPAVVAVAATLLIVGPPTAFVAGTTAGVRAAEIELSPPVGPPTAQVGVTGSGFRNGELVLVFFDRARVASTSAIGRGGVIALTVAVPASARPGEHHVTAMGTVSERSLTATFLVRTDWTQFHFEPGHTGFNPYENMLSAANAASLTVSWRHPTRGPITASPITCDGSVFVGDEAGAVSAFRTTGQRQWVTNVGAPITAALAAIPPGPCTILVAAGNTLSALNGRTGRPRWTVGLGALATAAPLVVDNPGLPGGPTIVVGDESGKVQTLNTDGTPKWSTPLNGAISATIAWSVPPYPDRPATLQVDPGDRIYATTDHGILASIDPATGAVVAAVTLDGPIVASPAVRLGFDPQPDPPKVYVGTTAGTLYALSADDLTEVWSQHLAAPVTASPAIGPATTSDDPIATIITPTGDGTIYAIREVNERPTSLWRAIVDGPIVSSPALANGVVVIGGDDSRIHALDAATGELLYESAAMTTTRSSPIVVDGTVLAGTTHGELVALAPQAVPNQS